MVLALLNRELSTFKVVVLIICSHLLSLNEGTAQTSLFRGELSGGLGYFPIRELPVMHYARYIPQYNLTIKERQDSSGVSFDSELSANLSYNYQTNPFDKNSLTGVAKLYRGWLRASTHNSELRVGLQKINFGSATVLRPLMWFDSVDPRDPVKFTEGELSALFRYYFTNNANLWVWAIYGKERLRAWETVGTIEGTPEVGLRFQHRIPLGEAAITYHRRKIIEGNEQRFAFDAKADSTAGLWTELVYTRSSAQHRYPTQSYILCFGSDYTFKIGNGLNILAEHLFASFNNSETGHKKSASFTALSGSYPLSISSHVNYILYYDWRRGYTFNFLNIKYNYKSVSINLMGYINPKSGSLPSLSQNQVDFGGNGVQVMLVYNHQSEKKRFKFFNKLR